MKANVNYSVVVVSGWKLMCSLSMGLNLNSSVDDQIQPIVLKPTFAHTLLLVTSVWYWL